MSNVGFILIYVENVAASEAFYASILDRPAIESSETFAMLPAAPGLMLGLWHRDGVKLAATTAGDGEIAFPVDGAKEVDALFADWRARRHDRPAADEDGFRLHLPRARSGRAAPTSLRAFAALSEDADRARGGPSSAGHRAPRGRARGLASRRPGAHPRPDAPNGAAARP